MGSLDRMMALQNNPTRIEVPMLQIVPDQDVAAKSQPHRGLQDAFRAEVRDRVAGGDFVDRERAALELANELVRAELTEALEDLVDGHGHEDVLVDGERYRLHMWGTGRYQSLVGTLAAARPRFRKVGERNGATVVPLELASGLMERASPALAERIAMGKADGTSRDLHRQLVASFRVPPSRSTLEVLGNAIGSALDRRQAVVEAVARRAQTLPAETRTIVLGLDRTSEVDPILRTTPRRS